MKRVVTLQDISCVGKCSITVALPIISALGIECAILPTAVLSTHTLFKNFTCKDLTDQIQPISAAWKLEHLTFNGIYTGYLSSPNQCHEVCSFIDNFKETDCLCLVDPAMADNGKLYLSFKNDFPQYMKKVCSRADVILPNITEACLLTGESYRVKYDAQFVQNLLYKLLQLGCSTAIITGVSYNETEIGAITLDHTGKISSYFTKKCKHNYHGTGDIFSSVVFSTLVNGLNIENALQIAADFVVDCIEKTPNSSDSWYGVNFEPQIPKLLNNFFKAKSQ